VTATNTSFWQLFAAPLGSRALRLVASGGEPSDAELVGQARQGDPNAMQQIYQRHADAVYRRLTHLVGADPEREDLLQEVFIALFDALVTFRGEASLTTFIYRIAANKAYDHLKRRRRTAGRQVLTGAPIERESATPSPERTAQDRRDAALMWQSLDDLAPKKRIAFVLRVVEGLSLQEISEQVGASVHAVAMRIRHAKLELIERIKDAKEDGR
jgi:RNA polymerase sigma-70 factor (ECF subfamily)